MFLRAIMPVTAKFSEEFYDRLGHRVADELVDWFNAVDATYRSDFRELFDRRFAQFDAKLEQRIGELRAELRAEFKTSLAETKTEMIRWMFIFWIGTVGPLAGLILAIVR